MRQRMSLPRSDKPPARAPSTPPEVNDARVRVRQLRAEAERSADRTAKAALLYEAGYLHEMVLHQPAQAAQDYLAAYNVDNRSRLPLHALVRMFERRRSYKNLARLYEAELRSARSAAERGTAHVDLAALGLIIGDTGSVQRELEQAVEHEPKTDASLLLEWNRRAAGDHEGYVRALELRIESCDDATQRGALLLELASLREARGEIEAALAALRDAALSPEPAEELYTVELARFAREHGFAEELADANERRAARLGFELTQREQEREVDPLRLDRLRAQAVASWYEAARLRCTLLGDPLGALRALDSAVSFAPDHLLLKQLRMLAYDLLEDRELAAAEASGLLAHGIEGEHAAALHFRLAERALVADEGELARDKLREAIQAAGGSAAAEAILDDLLLDEGRDDERIAQRESALNGSAEHALEALGEAAQIAAHVQGDREKTRALYERADAMAPASEVLLREAYGTALDTGDDELARFALDRLLALELAPDERGALVHHRYELADAADRLSLVDAELLRERPEVPRGALVQAAQARDHARLAELHEALARAAEDDEERIAERCAAARAWLRAGEPARARALLEAVVHEAPAQRYALTLLEEVLRSEGDSAGAIELLRGVAAQHESARDTELHLLSAGAAAELAGDAAGASASYRDAAAARGGKDEGSNGALWALFRLARRTHDVPLERSAREALSARELARGGVGLEALLLAEQLDLVEQEPAAAQAHLVPALDDPDVGHHAAIALALSRTAPIEVRERALELLATRATDSLRPALLRQLGGELVAHGARPARVLDLAERVSLFRPEDRWAIWARTHTRLAHQEDDPSALERLAAVTPDPSIADVARAEALWSRTLAAPEQPIAESLEALPPTPEELGSELGAELAATLAAIASPAHDANLRAQALERLARDAEPELRPRALLALARAQLGRDDASAAIATLEELLGVEPTLLAGWELAYVAARKTEHTELLARAAEQLAEHLDGEHALPLLEEAADVYIDQLDDLASGERLLTRALALEPTRAHAYARLHECLEQRADDAGLIALVRKRAALLDDPQALGKLYYELARLERKRGQLDAALDAIDNVLMLDDEHVGALALLVDVHTTRAEFDKAVSALDRLAGAPTLPNAQRRLALLGAADFLENRLDDRAAALARLEQLAEHEPDDDKVQLRIADLSERMAKLAASPELARPAYERTVKALAHVIERADAGERVGLATRRAALLEHALERRDEAAREHARVLAWAPGTLSAARAHFAIVGDREVLARVELELRAHAAEAARDPSPLRELAELAQVSGDRELAHIAESALAALAAAPAPEREQTFAKGVALRATELDALLVPSREPNAQRLLRTVFSAAAALDALEPARFDVGRGQRVSVKQPHALRDELRALCATLSLELGDLYVGGNEPTRIVALPRDGSLAFVAGPRVVSPLRGAQRHAAALQVAASYLDTLPLLTRGAADGARVLWAALAAEGVALPSDAERALGELPRSVGKALPRKLKKSLAELAQALPDGGRGLVGQCRSALAHTRRLALLLSGELDAALREVGGVAQDEALDLLRVWTSTAMSTSRRKLGLAS